jgi:hypothetical protein
MANIESAQALKLAGLRVLIVEDEALVAFQLEDMLADLGCAIIGPASRVAGQPDGGLMIGLSSCLRKPRLRHPAKAGVQSGR